MAQYKYLIELTQEYRQFEVVTDYQYPNEGEAILTQQYGGKEKCRVSYRGAVEQSGQASSSSIEKYKYLVELPKEYRQFEVLTDFKYPNEGEAALLAQYGGPDNCKVQYRGKEVVSPSDSRIGGSSSTQTSQSSQSKTNTSKSNSQGNGSSLSLGDLKAGIYAFQTNYRSGGFGKALASLVSNGEFAKAKKQLFINEAVKDLRKMNAKIPDSWVEDEGISAFSWMMTCLLLAAIILSISLYFRQPSSPEVIQTQYGNTETQSIPRNVDQIEINICVDRKVKEFRTQNNLRDDDVVTYQVSNELEEICSKNPNS